MPNDDPGLLITLNIGLTVVGILAAAVGLRQLREMHATGERIAGMTREVAFMIRRQ